MASFRDLLNGAGAFRVAPQSSNSSLEEKDIRALLGDQGVPYIVKKQPITKPLPGSIGEKNAGLHTADDQYAVALGRERSRIDNEVGAYREQQKAKRASIAEQAEAARQKYEAAMETAHSQALVSRQVNEANGGGWHPDSYYFDQALAAQGVPALTQAYGELSKQLTDFDAGFEQSIKDFSAPMEKNYTDAVNAAITLRDNEKKQGEFDAAYKTARSAYENAVTQHDKDLAAYQMYVAQKAQYDQDSANRTADIDAGRYAVNPYQFMAQGAGINEIEKLREQVNAGNLRPNMRVPDAEVAPTEVVDPGTFQGAAPLHQKVEAPKFSESTNTILGYKPPAPVADDAPLPVASTAQTDTSSVKPGYTSPEDKNAPKTDTAPKDSSGNVIVNQPTGAATLQETSTTANTATQSTPQTQTAAQAATPAPALAPQASGSVGGQGNSTGQDKTTQPEPKPEDKPAPFTPDEDKKEEQDSVF
jgi:hypothetical protein